MASSQQQGQVARAVYKALLRFAARAEGVPMGLRQSDIAALAPGLLPLRPGPGPGPQEEFAAAALRRLVRQAFREQRSAAEPEAAEALDRGFEAMALLHTEYQECLGALRKRRESHADRRGLALSVGTVFVHRKFGYRGVVLGWDRSCQREPGWAASMGVAEDQPFYSVLPDEDDCLRLLGGTRLSKYVAEENAEVLGPGAARGRVRHRAIANYFRGFSPALGRYIPHAGLEFEYPDAYAPPGAEEEQLEDCSADSNLLAGCEAVERQEAGASGGSPRGSPVRREGAPPRSEQLDRIASEFLGGT